MLYDDEEHGKCTEGIKGFDMFQSDRVVVSKIIFRDEIALPVYCL